MSYTANLLEAFSEYISSIKILFFSTTTLRLTFKVGPDNIEMFYLLINIIASYNHLPNSPVGTEKSLGNTVKYCTF